MPFVTNNFGLYLVKDEKIVGTNGGTFISNIWVTRQLNNIVTFPDITDQINLNNNQITFNKGKYWLSISCPAYKVKTHQSRLFNVTQNKVEDYGTSETSYKDTTHSKIDIFINVNLKNSYEIQHKCSSKYENVGLGNPCGFKKEVYTTLKIMKIC